MLDESSLDIALPEPGLLSVGSCDVSSRGSVNRGHCVPRMRNVDVLVLRTEPANILAALDLLAGFQFTASTVYRLATADAELSRQAIVADGFARTKPLKNSLS
jgi:hypothetical protein